MKRLPTAGHSSLHATRHHRPTHHNLLVKKAATSLAKAEMCKAVMSRSSHHWPATSDMERNQQSTKIDIETPKSVLVSTNLKTVINERSLSRLPPSSQRYLLTLLPACDRILSPIDGYTLALGSEALNNEFFSKSCVEWTDRLSQGEFAPEGRQNSLRNDATDESDPWKVRHFEKNYGERFVPTTRLPADWKTCELKTEPCCDDDDDEIFPTPSSSAEWLQAQVERLRQSTDCNLDDDLSTVALRRTLRSIRRKPRNSNGPISIPPTSTTLQDQLIAEKSINSALHDHQYAKPLPVIEQLVDPLDGVLARITVVRPTASDIKLPGYIPSPTKSTLSSPDKPEWKIAVTSPAANRAFKTKLCSVRLDKWNCKRPAVSSTYSSDSASTSSVPVPQDRNDFRQLKRKRGRPKPWSRKPIASPLPAVQSIPERNEFGRFERKRGRPPNASKNLNVGSHGTTSDRALQTQNISYSCNDVKSMPWFPPTASQSVSEFRPSLGLELLASISTLSSAQLPVELEPSASVPPQSVCQPLLGAASVVSVPTTSTDVCRSADNSMLSDSSLAVEPSTDDDVGLPNGTRHIRVFCIRSKSSETPPTELVQAVRTFAIGGFEQQPVCGLITTGGGAASERLLSSSSLVTAEAHKRQSEEDACASLLVLHNLGSQCSY